MRDSRYEAELKINSRACKTRGLSNESFAVLDSTEFFDGVTGGFFVALKRIVISRPVDRCALTPASVAPIEPLVARNFPRIVRSFCEEPSVRQQASSPVSPRRRAIVPLHVRVSFVDPQHCAESVSFLFFSFLFFLFVVRSRRSDSREYYLSNQEHSLRMPCIEVRDSRTFTTDNRDSRKLVGGLVIWLEPRARYRGARCCLSKKPISTIPDNSSKAISIVQIPSGAAVRPYDRRRDTRHFPRL